MRASIRAAVGSSISTSSSSSGSLPLDPAVRSRISLERRRSTNWPSTTIRADQRALAAGRATRATRLVRRAGRLHRARAARAERRRDHRQADHAAHAADARRRAREGSRARGTVRLCDFADPVRRRPPVRDQPGTRLRRRRQDSRTARAFSSGSTSASTTGWPAIPRIRSRSS